MNKIFKILFISCFLFLACSCASTRKLGDIIKEDNYIIVDVRTKEEYDVGHVKDSINIPYETIVDANLDKNKTILVYCQSGKRSRVAYESLKKMKYDVYDLGAFDKITLEKE